MRLLLHICCAPCLIYPLGVLREKGFSVEGLFYNPNIHPFLEYKNREQAVADFSRGLNFDVTYPEYIPSDFFRRVNLEETKPQRCSLCWSQRLKTSATYAREKNFDYFSTTLLVSPYQDQDLLKDIGNSIAKETQIQFYYQDFRGGFREAHQEAKAKNIYCQKYCGCLYSELERYKKS